MNKHIAYNFVLILIIIQCVKSQDNDPDQPDEEDEDNFEVLDLDKIIEQRISRFEDPRYQHYDYYQPELQEYPTQPETQPEQHDLYQSYDQYQPESQEYQPGDQYYPGYQQEHQQCQPEYQYYPGYQPEHQQYQPEQYGQYQPYETQIQTQEQQYYVPPTTQPATQAPQVTQESQTIIHSTQPTYQQHYGFYQPVQQTEQLEPEVIQVQQIDDEEKEKERQPRAQLLEKLKQKIQRPQSSQPGKRTRPQTTSGDQDEEEEDEEELVKVHPLISPKKSIHIKFFKRDSDGNLVEMTYCDYVIIYGDPNKTEYMFIVDLEQIECDDRIIYQHIDGTPYCVSLIHSKKTNVFVMTNSDGFTLVKKIRGKWTTTQEAIPDFVKMFTKNEEGKLIYLTKEKYTVTFTSNGSFRYTLIPVKWLTVWEKTDKDEEFPTG
ncbi:SVSP family protein [Theileria parva strain Muguga]|uniref:Theileria-specific sub-telomeric protein, SVSP family n=1 Tax=Theileria parva TaxID=5875 RepID=Q4MYG8_THEPA|nr:SVSP family protein [Theileria parva strain Muguga]EAN30714.1 SVSP family protein [Theileria parva strain Muguga]|eukprot:XP_762997.1 hypothetical protein [Theileria parva strain Muguga]